MIAITDNKGKRELFFIGSETQNTINCEHVIVQRVVLLFFRLNFNKLYTISLTKIVKITYAIYQGLS